MTMLRFYALVGLGLVQMAVISFAAFALMHVGYAIYVAVGLDDSAHRAMPTMEDERLHTDPDCAHPVVLTRGASREDSAREFGKLLLQMERCPTGRQSPSLRKVHQHD